MQPKGSELAFYSSFHKETLPKIEVRKEYFTDSSSGPVKSLHPLS